MRSLNIALPLALSLALPAIAQEADTVQIANWTAPPYWAGTLASSSPAGGPQPLAASALPSAPLPFVAIAPCRIVDTRGYGAPIQGGIYGASEARVYLLAGQCAIPSGAAAVSLNVTVTNAQGAGFILIHPAGTAPPTVSTINYVAGQTIANAAIVPLNASGEIRVVAGVSGTDLILDTNGYYAPINLVNTVNTLAGDVTLSPGANVSITPSGNTLTIAASATSGPPTGAAGGSLTGSYPNPGIASGAVGAAQLANAAVVRSINGAAQDLVTIAGAGGASVSTNGSTITIGAPAALAMVLGAPGDTTLVGAGYTEVVPSIVESWRPLSTDGAPSPRGSHTAVWTGSKMVVWGGADFAAFLNSGGVYDPATDSWVPTATTGAPEARWGPTSVWTGSRMIVWGGMGVGGPLANGGMYDPAGDSWSPVSTIGAPPERVWHTAVWTGSRMVVWGGTNISEAPRKDGGRYDPIANTWQATGTPGAPAGRKLHAAVWTGSHMIVWGGSAGGYVYFNDGARYDPVGDTWATMAGTGAPTAREGHTAVWTASRMIVWGGHAPTPLDTGGRYDPVADSWAPVSTKDAPTARAEYTAVWTGFNMVVWGGNTTSSYLATGARYDPVADRWTALTGTGAPLARNRHTAVFTGSRMIVWGGNTDANPDEILNDGGSWTAASLYARS